MTWEILEDDDEKVVGSRSSRSRSSSMLTATIVAITATAVTTVIAATTAKTNVQPRRLTNVQPRKRLVGIVDVSVLPAMARG